jgi:hypothetical protein
MTMKDFFRIKILTLLIFVVSFSAFGQSNAQIEQELTATIEEVQRYSTYGDNYDDDKLDKANEEFNKKLLKYTKKAATLKYDFPKFGKLIIIATSKDGKFRTYSWDEEHGGTMHDYTVVYQYQGADGKIYSWTDKDAATDSGNIGAFVHSIYSVNSKAGKIYIVCLTFIGGTSYQYGSANLYKINGNKLIDKVKLFKTKKGFTDSIGFDYNFFSVVDRPERPIKLILFNEKTKTVKIPIVIKNDENDYGTVTNKFINYKFNGNYFVKLK